MPLIVHVVEWQHLVLAQDTLLGMHLIVHTTRHVLMSPPKVAFALRPFPLAAPPKHVLQCWLVLWRTIC